MAIQGFAMPVIAVGAVLTLIDNGRQREFGFLTCRSTPAGSTGVFRREYWSIPPGVLEYSAGSTGVFRRECRSIPPGVPEHFGKGRKIGPVMLRFGPPMTWPAQDGSVRAAVANADFSEFFNRFA